MASLCFFFLSALLFLIGQSEQKPVGSFIQIFDANKDGQVDIITEIGAYYDNITQLLLNDVANGTANGTASLGQIGLDDLNDFISVAEARQIDEKLVNGSDVDGDGQLNVAEQANFSINFASRILDKNHDGIVSGEESAQYDEKQTEMQFKRYDTNGDEKLSEDELEALVQEFVVPLRSMITNILPKKEDIPLERAKELLGKELGVKPAQIDAADVDKNGKLSFQGEFLDNIGLPLEGAKNVFAAPNSTLAKVIDEKMVERADKDGNGFLKYKEMINLLTVDAAMKLGDANKDGFLDQKEYLEGFSKLQAIFLNAK